MSALFIWDARPRTEPRADLQRFACTEVDVLKSISGALVFSAERGES